MINTKLTARVSNGHIDLMNPSGTIVATFETLPYFYIVTGFKTIEAYNEHQNEQPIKFLVWEGKY